MQTKNFKEPTKLPLQLSKKPEKTSLQIGGSANAFIFAHMDDETFSYYGLIQHSLNAQKIDKKDIVLICMCQGRINDPNNYKRLNTFREITKDYEVHLLNHNDLNNNLTDIPKIADEIYEILDTRKCYLSIYLPSIYDLHQDHKLLNNAAKVAIVRYMRDLENHNIGYIAEVAAPFKNLDKNARYDWSIDVDPKEKEKVCKLYSETQPDYYSAEYCNFLPTY